MRSLSSREVVSSFTDILSQVASTSEHIAIQRPGEDPVYVISARDYQLLQAVLEKAENELDLKIAEERMADPHQELIPFDQFFSELGA